MRNSTKKITLTAAFTALSVVFLYVASISPTGHLGIIAVASLFGIAATVEAGIGGGAAVYIAASAISFFLLPNKNTALIYIVFFGLYPLIKAIAEKQRSRAVEWLIKLAAMNASLAVLIFALSALVFDISLFMGSYPVLFLAVNAVFLVFDFGATKLTAYYINNISRRIRRG